VRHIPPEHLSPHGHISRQYRAGRIDYATARAQEDEALPRCVVHHDRPGKFIINNNPRCVECATGGRE
jgi:hypothetical protein